jgi:hypothetical protein
MEKSTIFNGKIHDYFYGHFQYVDKTRGIIRLTVLPVTKKAVAPAEHFAATGALW